MIKNWWFAHWDLKGNVVMLKSRLIYQLCCDIWSVVVTTACPNEHLFLCKMYSLVWYLTTVFFLLFSSVTACSLQLEWAAWLKMRPQCPPARQKSPLSLKDNNFTTPDVLFPDVFLILNGCHEMEISKWIQADDCFCNKLTLISECMPMAAFHCAQSSYVHACDKNWTPTSHERQFKENQAKQSEVFSCDNDDGMFGCASEWESSAYAYDMRG